MSQWIRAGLRTGIKTTAYPAAPETAPGVSPGLPVGGPHPRDEIAGLIARCPTGAISAGDAGAVVDARRCVHSYRCRRGVATPLEWAQGYEWAIRGPTDDPRRRLGPAFRRSAHVIVVDAGDCGACLNEVKQLAGPYYNMHRLGLFLTPTPRHADVLLVVGPVTDHMRVALLKTWEAMPTPKRVLAVGTCALSGGVFGPSFVAEGGVASVLPVDVEVPGQPPPPLAILHGLLTAVGRAPAGVGR
ncbi:MAG TPA: 4Fe-4S ferredoxin [Candidatus Binatia bacterium]|nr:4Fe-4S ferredoxin [Candidatus Binatia bacterium]